MSRLDPKVVALDLLKTKYPGARVILLAGSVIRGEGTEYSDLDLVVLFEQLENAWRDSYMHGGWPVEAFVHDPMTLRYFMEEEDAPSGCPALAQMVVEGIAIPEESSFSLEMQSMAQVVLDVGPPNWNQQEVDTARYFISDVVDDLRSPRSKHEAIAAGTRLYEKLADFHLRSQGKWSATGKSIPRVLRKSAPEFAQDFLSSFDVLFAEGNAKSVIDLAEKTLRPFGGFYFEGHKLDAPKEWRK
jgi:hypothetical protein